MTVPDPDEKARELAAESLADADPTGWFERLYTEAAQGRAIVPWDRGHPHRLLLEWVDRERVDGHGRRALVVGCGLGEDAELMAARGFDTVAFDISATAVETARTRHPNSTVEYLTADLLSPPGEWSHAFDLVVESLTVQSMPPATRPTTIANVARFVGPGGTLVVVASAAVDGESGGPPWPLGRAEIDAFGADGLTAVRIEELADPLSSAVRWRAEYRRRAT
jgi:SAM-dependent methyltransferase